MSNSLSSLYISLILFLSSALGNVVSFYFTPNGSLIVEGVLVDERARAKMNQ